MFSLIITLIIVVAGGGSLAVASDNARPGDALFGVDRAVENVRISFSGKDKKNELRVKFAEERIKEVEEIIREDDKEDVSEKGEIDINTVSEIEADVFTNETVVKVESENKVKIFVISASTEETIIAELSKRFEVAPDVISRLLNVEFEDRESREEDKRIRGEVVSLNDKNKHKVTSGIEHAALILTEISGDMKNENAKAKLEAIIEKFNVRINSLPEDTRIELKDNLTELSLKMRKTSDSDDIEDTDDVSDTDDISDIDDDDEDEMEGRVEIKSVNNEVRIEWNDNPMKGKRDAGSGTQNSSSGKSDFDDDMDDEDDNDHKGSDNSGSGKMEDGSKQNKNEVDATIEIEL